MFNSSIKIDKKIIIIICLILFGITLRLIPHPPNFSPIGAIALFAGCHLSLKRFWLLPIFALFISDFFLGFYNLISMISVYVSFVISVIIGYCFLRIKRTSFRICGVAILSTTQFFIFTNLGVWFSGLIYQLNLTGLAECYLMAIPFYGNSLISELFYCFVLFGAYHLFELLLRENYSPGFRNN